MKSIIIGLLFSCVLFAETKPTVHLISYSMDIKTCIIEAITEEGHQTADGDFVAEKQHVYHIDLHKAVMSKDGEMSIKFSQDESNLFHQIMNAVVTDWIAENIVWYDSTKAKMDKETNDGE